MLMVKSGLDPHMFKLWKMDLNCAFNYVEDVLYLLWDGIHLYLLVIKLLNKILTN